MALTDWFKKPTEEELAEEERLRKIEEDALFYTNQIPNSLARMKVAAISKDNKRLVVNKVKISDTLAMDDYVMLLVDTTRLPFGLKIKDLCDPEVLKTLGGACRTPVDFEYNERAGFWYIIERKSGYGAIPRVISYAEAKEIAPQGNRWTFLIGVGANKRAITADLRRTPNLVMAGSVGAGKTVEMKQIILTLAMNNSPKDLRICITDFKDGVDFKTLESLPHLGTPTPVTREKSTEINDAGEMVDVVTDDNADRIITEPEDLLKILRYARREVHRRNKILAKAKEANNIDEWNALFRFRKMPRILICIDEIAVAMLELKKSDSKEIETLISGISRLGRAPGIHLIFGTQSVTKEILTATINHNFTARIAGYCATGPQSGLALGTGSYAATRIDPIPGRAVWRDGLHEIEMQMPYLKPREVVEMLEEVKKKWNEPDLPIEMQLFVWALKFNKGRFAVDEVFEANKDIVTQAQVLDIGAANEYNGEDERKLEIPGYDSLYVLLPEIPGKLPRRLVAEGKLHDDTPDTPKYEVTATDLFRFAINNLEGRFSSREIYEHFEGKISKSEIERIGKVFTGKEVEIDGEFYKLEPGRGNKPKTFVSCVLCPDSEINFETDRDDAETEIDEDEEIEDEENLDETPDWLK